MESLNDVGSITYFNADGSVIRSIKDIKGSVFDSAGEEILKVADIARGLVDRSGKPLIGMSSGILGSLLKIPFKVAGAVGKGARALTKLNIAALKMPFKIGGKIAALFKGGKASPELKVSAHTADTIDAIYSLLDARMPKPKGSWTDRDGSGFRDGSREDVLSRNKPKDKAVPTPENTASNERRGILGMLMAMVGGIGTVIGTMRSWFGNIFGMMRLAAQTKMATSAFDAIGALAGRGRRGRGTSLVRRYAVPSRVQEYGAEPLAAVRGICGSGTRICREEIVTTLITAKERNIFKWIKKQF